MGVSGGRWRASVAILAACTWVTCASAAWGNPRELIQRYYELDRKLSDLVGDYSFLRDEAQVAEKRDAVIKTARELDAVLEQIEQNPEIGGLAQYRRVDLAALLIVLGDEDAKRRHAERSENTGDPFGVCVDVALAFFRAEDDDARSKALDRFETLMDQPASRHELSGTAHFILATAGPGPFEDRTLDFVRRKLTSSTAAQVALQYEGARKLRSSLGKPLTFRGSTVDGKTLQSADFRGKVLILHFFATTDEPSVEDIRRVQRAYILNRAKGVELVSVSCDVQKSALTLYLERNRRVTWPVLFDEFSATANKAWHPLTLQIGVGKLPKTLLVDRKGVLRYADPADLDAKLKELIDEPSQ